MQTIGSMLACGITPYAVFDGRPLPAKAPTHLRRKDNLERATESLKEKIAEGCKISHSDYRAVLCVTSEFTKEVIEVCIQDLSGESELGLMPMVGRG